MALTDYTAYVAGLSTPTSVKRYKQLASTAVTNGPWLSAWKQSPDGASNPSSADSNLGPTTPGSLFPAVAAVGTPRIAQIEGSIGIPGVIMLCDRLAHVAGMDGTLTSAQAAAVALGSIESAGTYQFAGTATAAHSLTLTRPIPAGHTVVLFVYAGFTTTASIAVTDTGSNTWDLTNEEYQASSSNSPYAVNCRLTTGLKIGDTITFTFKDTANGVGADVAQTRVVASVAHVSGQNTSGVLKDQVSTGTGTSQTPAPGTTGTPSQAGTIQFQALRVALGAADSGDLDKVTTIPSGWTLLNQTAAYTGTSGIQIMVVYRIQTTATAPAAGDSWTLDDATHAWRVMTYGLKAAPNTSRVDAGGVQAAIEIYTQIGTTGTTVTASYSNQAGTSGRATPAIAIGTNNSREPGRFFPLPLQSGDTSVKSVETATLAGTTGTAGLFGVTLYRPLAIFGSGTRGFNFLWDAVHGGGMNLPSVNGICPFLLYHYSGNQAGEGVFDFRILDT